MTQTFSLKSLLPSAQECPECRRLLQLAIEKLPKVKNVQIDRVEVRLEGDSPNLETAVDEVKSQHTHGSFKVEGMDCASCAKTVEGAVCRIQGVSDYKLNYVAQKLEVAYDPQQAKPADFKAKIEPLGYKVQPIMGLGRLTAKTPATAAKPEPDLHDHSDTHDPTEEHSGEKAWYQTRQGRDILITGTLLVLAWVFGWLEPNLSRWGYTLATVVGGWPFALKAVRAALVGNPFSINTLMSVAAIGAIWIDKAPEAATVVFLFAVGELLEGVAAGRARAGIRSLVALAPKTALLLHGDHAHEVRVESLKVGQVVRIRPGDRVPADGTILKGESALDDSPITGESVPVHKGIGAKVYAGSINTDGTLEVRVDTPAQDNTIARIIQMVERAEESKAPTARFIDRFSRYYTPIVILVSAAVAILPPLFGASWSEWLYKGLALLLIGCPCALLISVPAAITSGISSGARRGLLIKGGATLETLGSIQTIAFDKTGTLTEGKPSVTDVIALEGSENEVLAKAAAIELASSHPLAKAILNKAQASGVPNLNASGHRAISGKAALATLEGREHAVGSARFASELKPLSPEIQSQIEILEAQGKTVSVVLNTPKPIGLIALRDEARPDSASAVAKLKTLGVRGVMLTGDNQITGTAIADKLGLEVRAELLPQDKLKLIDELKTGGSVAMVGDGINDAPALAQADVGIAMGAGTEVALEAADAALLRNSLAGVTDLVELSRATMSNIRQNIAVALGLKAIFLVTTLLGITNLWMAILADTGATVLVTANALRLLTFRPK